MQRDNWMKCRSSTRFRREGERVSGRSPESSSPAHHRLQDLPAEEILGRPCPRLHDLRRIQGQGGPACCVPGEDFIDNVVCWMNELKNVNFPTSLPTMSLLLPLPGRLWWSSAVPDGTRPLGGARRGELRPDRLHRGEQTQRFHPHRHLHPLDRGNTHQGLLPALNCFDLRLDVHKLFSKEPQFIHVPQTQNLNPLPDVNTCSECAIIVFSNAPVLAHRAQHSTH